MAGGSRRRENIALLLAFLPPSRALESQYRSNSDATCPHRITDDGVVERDGVGAVLPLPPPRLLLLPSDSLLCIARPRFRPHSPPPSPSNLSIAVPLRFGDSYREIQAVLAFLALAAVKLVREETWEAFIADSLFFSKVFLVVVTLVIDYLLALWYILVFLVIFTLTQQPVSQFLGTASKITPLQLETVLNDGGTSRFWLVEFRSSCSSSCIRASRCFADLSITYSNKNLSFAIVDLGLFPIVAEKFGISLGNMAQLPTYILFENATEIARLPDIDLGVKISYPPITKVCFELVIS
ncbi:uncharacterized protein J3R85_011684 [Psidium guajava]|nr:uncharacterized protein J3R85_011684 [Psidium guajava]